ncbi:MAG: hypothetical protein ACRC62_04565 [Microcoleus sp.]
MTSAKWIVSIARSSAKSLDRPLLPIPIGYNFSSKYFDNFSPLNDEDSAFIQHCP